MREIITTNEGKIILTSGYYYGSRYSSAEQMAIYMTDSDLEKLLEACGGDFSKFDDITAKVIALKASAMVQKRNERKAREALARAERKEARHRAIMDEIKEFNEDVTFSATSIQRQVANSGRTPHTRQMYTAHFRKACADGEMKRVGDTIKCITVVYANGKKREQKIVEKGYYKFI